MTLSLMNITVTTSSIRAMGGTVHSEPVDLFWYKLFRMIHFYEIYLFKHTNKLLDILYTSQARQCLTALP
jgi:hypothetical protein